MNEVIELLNKKNIKYNLVEHDEVHTIEDMEKLGLLDKGYVCKNLFLRNANGKEHYLVACSHEKNIDLKDLATKIGSTRLSFGSDERLKKYLGLEQGYVSPFGVVNNDDESVIFVFDKDLKNMKNVGFHPNTNKATLFLDFNDVAKIIDEHGNEIMYISI